MTFKASQNKLIHVITFYTLAFLITGFITFGTIGHIEFRHFIYNFIIFIVFSNFNKINKYLYIPLLIIVTFYFPIGIDYGIPNSHLISSLLYTNVDEAIGFMNNIPLYYFLLSIITIFLIILNYKFLYKTNYKINKKLVYLLLIALLSPMIIDKAARARFFNSSYPFGFYYSTYSNFKLAQKEYEDSLNFKSEWQIKKINDTGYNNFVLVIGESLRKDYLSAYGYPIKTSPFLNNVNGTFLDGLIAPSYTTAASLSRMLTLNNSIENIEIRINYKENIIDLANIAGFETFWLSNQGRYGSNIKYNPPASVIGKRSKYTYFLQTHESNSNRIRDHRLLEPFKNVLNNNENKKKFIILHLMGSHLPACDRVDNIESFLKGHPNGIQYECYLQSVYETDKLLKSLYTELKLKETKSGEKFTLMFFSDHGQGQDNERLRHDGHIKQGYEVPFVIINSDDTMHKMIKAQHSGINMVSILANWLGVETYNIPNKYNIFSEESDSNITVLGNTSNLSKIVKFKDLKDDKVINPLQ